MLVVVRTNKTHYPLLILEDVAILASNSLSLSLFLQILYLREKTTFLLWGWGKIRVTRKRERGMPWPTLMRRKHSLNVFPYVLTFAAFSLTSYHSYHPYPQFHPLCCSSVNRGVDFQVLWMKPLSLFLYLSIKPQNTLNRDSVKSSRFDTRGFPSYFTETPQHNRQKLLICFWFLN